MAVHPVCYAFCRILLPLSLLAATVVRYNAFSLAYGVLLLVGPLLPRPSHLSIRGHTGRYLIFALVICSLTLLSQIVFQGYLLGTATGSLSYGHNMPNCSTLEIILRQIGMQRVEPYDVGSILRTILPDVVAFLGSLATVIVCFKSLSGRAPDEEELLDTTRTWSKRRRAAVFNTLGDLLVALLLAASGIMHPSLLSSIYFVAFITMATWWSFYRTFGNKFGVVRTLLLVYSGLHLVVLYLYQFQTAQWMLDHESLVARLVGLTAIVETDCVKPWLVQINPDITWPMYVSPIVILVLYFVLASETTRWRQQADDMEATSVTDMSSTSRARGHHRRQKSGGSERQVLAMDDHDDDDPAEVLVDDQQAGQPNYQSTSPTPGGDPHNDTTAAVKPSEERSPLQSVFSYVMQHSYVCALIVMMLWSITYHSWLTFVFLLLSCFIWVVPQKRRVTLVCSPFILLYALVLLTIQYVYGLQLTDTELPVETPGGYPYQEIGLIKNKYACKSLAIQIVFTALFWVTLREWMKERRGGEDQPSHGVPLETLNGATSTDQQVRQELPERRGEDGTDGYNSENMQHVGFSNTGATTEAPGIVRTGKGEYLWRLLCKYWVFVCIALFIVMAIPEPVIYRIIYMVFLLYFVLSFQLCYRWWRVTGHVFWWVVIIYTMLVLCAIYTYQFRNSPQTWHSITGWSYDILLDIGLKQFDTATLLVKLAIPTVFLIACNLQVHYFQSPLLRLSQIDRYKYEKVNGNEADVETIETSPNGVEATNPETDTDTAEPKETTNRAADPRGGGDAPPEGGAAATPQGGANADPDSPDSQPTDGDWESIEIHKPEWHAKILRQVKTFVSWYRGVLEQMSTFLWKILDVHIAKIVFFTIFTCALSEVSAMNTVLVLLLIIGLPFRKLYSLVSRLCLCWTSVIILSKMVYQLRFVPRYLADTNCTHVFNGSSPADLPPPFNETIHGVEYLGLRQSSNLAWYLKNYLVIVMALGFEAIVWVHQRQFYAAPTRERPTHGIIFPEVQRAQADRNLSNCLKFLVNYAFYKFGLEICFITTVVSMVVRLDAYSVLYGVFLGALLLLSRRHCYFLWPAYTILLVVLLVTQYLSCLGAPPVLCWEYPWGEIPVITRNLKVFLFLPDYLYPPSPFKLLADFFQLLFVCGQWHVFWVENNPALRVVYGGGSNTRISNKIDENTENPADDFTSYKDSYLDYVKAGVFQHTFWVTLIIVFIAGVVHISLFCMGYLIGCFVLLWLGKELLIRPLRVVLRMWGVLLGYTFFVIISKCCLQLVGCVYLSALADRQCWVVQMFSIECLSAGNYREEPAELRDCYLKKDSAGLAWDATCFVFLLIQLRIFRSHYFRHVVTDLIACNKLAARGAELINTDLIKTVEMRHMQEEEGLNRVKRKMKRIKLRQARLHQKVPFDSNDHFVVIRSGDYYMFEDDSDDDDIISSEDAISPEAKQESKEALADDEPRLGPLQLINMTFKSGTKQTLDVVKRQEDDRAVSPHRKSMEGGGDAPDGAVEPEPLEEIEPEQPIEKEPLKTRIVNGIKVAWEVFGTLIEQLIHVLNGISYRYRNISKILDEEKEEEKKRMIVRQKEGGEGVETQPLHHREVTLLVDIEETEAGDQEKEKKFQKKMPRLLRLCLSLFDALMSRSELVCYFVLILNHLVNASLLSLVYPVSVFLWAMLSVPRPDKTYWVVVITYTEAVVLVKYLFQFGFIPWNKDTPFSHNPFFPPRIIGIEQKSDFALFDLFVLFCLFIHRSVLKRHGLWKDAQDTDKDLARAEENIATVENTPVVTPEAQPDQGERSLEATSELGQSSVIFEYSSAPEEEDRKAKSKKAKKDKDGLVEVFMKPMFDFYKQMTNTKYHMVTDVYALMFLCDVITFIIVVFGYSSFGPAEQTAGEESVTSVISENKVPVPFLVMLLAQFVLMIVDRALYLRKDIFGKFILQIILVIVVHIWMFFILPLVTQRSFRDNTPAQLWYFVKCVYFGLSAYQIRSSYPYRILGNFLTKKYNYANLFLFKGFLAIPFLLELRCLMDWMWTDTTLSIGPWLQVEDIYANIFCLECWRTSEKTYLTPRGMKKKAVIKYGIGGLLLFVLIFIIWFPLLLFSLANAVFQANPPIECELTIQFGSYEPVFHMVSPKRYMKVFSEYNFSKLKAANKENKGAIAFLSAYSAEDVYMIEIDGESSALWEISPPSIQNLYDDFMNKSMDVNMYTSVIIKREPKKGMTSNTVSADFVFPLKANDAEAGVIRRALAGMINGTVQDSIYLGNVFPRFMHVPATGMISTIRSIKVDNYSNVTLQLEQSKSDKEKTWWKLQEKIRPHPFDPVHEHNKPSFQNSLTVITFNDRVAPDTLSFFTNYGIIGLYVSFILVIGSFVRMQTSGLTHNIMFDELPFVQRILHLCNDIYLVRESGDMALEEELVAKLIFLYRSPQTMIKWTRPPKEKDD